MTGYYQQNATEAALIMVELTDIGNSGSDADLDSGVAFLSKLTLEELVQFGVENAIGDKLPLLGDRSCLCRGHDCVLLRD